MDFDEIHEPVIVELKGGDKLNAPKVQVYKPHITRKNISIYEYAGLLTKLAKYLAGIPDINNYVDEPYINSIINPTELAFTLLENHKFDAILDRGYEKVSYSQLTVNENWKDMLREYFKDKNTAIKNEIIIPFGLE